MSEATLDGPNETVAVESELETVPPLVGETICGGERPLDVFALGSGGVDEVPLGVDEPSWLGGVVALAPTRTVIVPVPEPAVAVVVPVPFAGSPVPVVVAVVSVPPCVVVEGVELVDVSCGRVTDCDVPVVVDDEELPVVVPPVFDVPVVVPAGGSGVVGVMLFTFGSGAALVSAGGTVVVLVPVAVLVPVLLPVLVPVPVVVFEPDEDVWLLSDPELEEVELGCGSVKLCWSCASAAATCASAAEDEGASC